MKVADTKSNAHEASKPSGHFFHQEGGKHSFFGDQQNHSFLQPKLNVGKANDQYEREADHIADQVVANNSFFTPATTTHAIQNKCAGCEKEDKKEKEIQKKPLIGNISPLVQRQPDPEEEDIQAKLLIQLQPEEEEEVQAKFDLQKNEAEEEEALQAKTEPSNSSTSKPGQSVEASIRHSKGSGTPLSGGIKHKMESSFGADFSNVRIHTSSEAVQMSKHLGAQAFTHGSDIYFNAGKYAPVNKDGEHLLAHELTHTIQQGAVTRLKPEIQREEADISEELKKELEESEKEQEAAIDPSEANQTRVEAQEEGQKAQEATSEDLPSLTLSPTENEAEEKAPIEGRIAEAKSTPSDKVSSEIISEEKPLGPAGQQLANDSANACQDAADKSQTLANNQQAHDDAGEKLNQTEAAVVPPTEEGQSRSNATQVDTVNEAETPDAPKEDIEKQLDQSIQESVPSSIEDMNEFESKKKGQVIGNEVLAVSSEQVGAIQGTYQEVENAPLAEPAEVPDVLPPIEEAPPTPQLNLGEGAVPDVPEEQTNLDSYQQEADELIEKEGITPEMKGELKNVDSGPLAEANKERAQLDEKVQNEPANLQNFARVQQQQVETDMVQEENQAKMDMEQKRQLELEGAQNKQKETKSVIEQKREEVTKWINDRYEAAKALVDEKLKGLEQQALQTFDEGQQRFSKEFESSVKRRVNAWKRERYSGIFGGVKWLKDKLVGIDHFPEIKQIFKDERESYIQKIDHLIVDINKENDKTIQECKDEITKANTEIKEYVDNLGPDLKDVGQSALEETKQKLADLDKHVEEEKKKLQDRLCSKREAAIQAIDAKIEEMKSEMSGLISKLGNLLVELAKKFFMWALEKFGLDPSKIMAVISKGISVLKAIFTDPIGFFKNLGRAVGGGIKKFVSNIVTHLKNGLINWLTGAMGDSGLQLPEKFDLKGILSLGLQIAGLTWTNIRTRLVKKLGPNGEKMVSTAEKGIEIVSRVVKEGPIALWHIIVEKAEEFKTKVMEGIRNWAITQIVKKATIKLISTLNPVGAIVQAIITLYDVVMFFVNNWQQILDFVDSIFSSISNIAKGAIGQASAFIEKTLALTIPLILKFLAQFLGLGGIGKTIRNIIQKIQRPINNLLDKIIGFLVNLVKKLFKGGKALVKSAKGKILQWWKFKKPFKSEDGKSHTISYKGKGKSAKLVIESTPQTIQQIITAVTAKEKDDRQTKSFNQLKILNTSIEERENKLEGTMDTATKQAEYNNLQIEINKATILISILIPLIDTEGVPKSIMPAFQNGVLAKSFEAIYITKNQPTQTPNGEDASVNNGQTLKGWSNLQMIIQGGKTVKDKDNKMVKVDATVREIGNYVKMHLLHDGLGGKATDSNLVPAKSGVNTNFYNQMENFAVTDIQAGKILWYSVKVKYHPTTPVGGIPNIDYSGYPKSIIAQYGYLKFDNKTKQWNKGPASPKAFSDTDIEIPNFGNAEDRKFNPNRDGWKNLMAMEDPDNFPDFHISVQMARFINKERTDWEAFTSYNGDEEGSFINRMTLRKQGRPGGRPPSVPRDFEKAMSLINRLYSNGRFVVS